MTSPAHPGRSVRGAIDDLGLTVTEAARVLNVSRPALSRVLNGQTGVPAEMAVRLSKAIGGNPEFWLRLRMNHDLAQVAQRDDTIVVNPLPQSPPQNQ